MNEARLAHSHHARFTGIFLLTFFGILPFVMPISRLQNPVAPIVLVTATFVQEQPRPATVPGSSDPTGDEWPMFRGALNHSGSAMTIPANSSGPCWIKTISNLMADRSIAGGRIYTGKIGNITCCLDAITGMDIWTCLASGCIIGSPAIAEGRVYVSLYDNKTCCLNASTGALLWSFMMKGPASAPAVERGRVFFGSYWNDSKVYCLNATTGVKLWSFSTPPEGGYCSPAIAYDRLYIRGGSAILYCLNETTGALIWSQTIPGLSTLTSPVIAYGRVYLGDYNHGIVYCLQAFTGSFIWSSYSDPYDCIPVYAELAIADGRVYVPITTYSTYRSYSVRCLNSTTGMLLWSYNHDSYSYCDVAIAGRVVYFGDYHKMYCLNAASGTLVWTFSLNANDVYAYNPSIGAGRLYFTSFNGTTYNLPLIVMPTAPEGLEALPDKNTVKLSWYAPTASNGITFAPGMNYSVYRGSSPGSEVRIATLSNISLSSDQMVRWNDTTVITGVTYYYKVCAVVNGLNSNFSAEMCVIAGAPTEPCYFMGEVKDGHVLLSWAPPVSDGGSPIVKFNIYRGISKGNETLLTSTTDWRSWTDMSVVGNQTYYYTMSAVNNVHEGLRSIEISVTMPYSPDYFSLYILPAIIWVLSFIVIAIVIAMIAHLRNKKIRPN